MKKERVEALLNGSGERIEENGLSELGATGSEQPSKKSPRFATGVVVSGVWILLMGWLAYSERANFDSMALNAWGDFFAGVFAPLAFLWLVLGYLQQGDELRLSTNALRQQAIELKGSVAQQQALVKVAQEDSESRTLAARPQFRIEPDGEITADGVRSFRFKLRNYGAPVAMVAVRLFDRDGNSISQASLPFFDGRAQKEFGLEVIKVPGNAMVRVEVGYLDFLGHPGSAEFVGGFDEQNQHSVVRFP